MADQEKAATGGSGEQTVQAAGPEAGQIRPRPGEGGDGEAARLAGWRRWIFPPAAAILIPALLLGALELGLRLAGYGFSPRFFVPIEGLAPEAPAAWTPNPRFGWRFFPPTIARTPAVCSLAEGKGPNSVRLFVLGGSAAMGTPEAAFGFGRLLEAMLAESFPEVELEVVNAALTAANSHVVLPIGRECARFQPDAFLIYLGNNEVVGPYGPGTIFSGFSDHLTAIRASLWLKGTRTGQLVSNLASRLSRSNAEARAEWEGLEMFRDRRVAADDPRLAGVYDHLRANLEDLLAVAGEAGARVVISTVAVNLIDNPPFASLHRGDLTADELSRWQESYDRAVELLTGDSGGEERVRQTLEALTRAEGIDDRYAELHFLLGHTLRSLGQEEEAEEHFLLARDLDALRFRADGRINEIIRAVATGREAEGVALIDGEAAVAGSTLESGAEVFWEHVHLNLEGNYRLAAAYFEAVTRLLADRLGVVEGAAPAPPSRQRVAEVLGLTHWDRYRMAAAIEEMLARPPFTDQLAHQERTRQLRRLVRQLRLRLRRGSDDSEQIYRRALEGRPDDLALRANFAQLLKELGKTEEATAEWDRLLSRVPGVVEWRTQRAYTLADAAAPAGEPGREPADQASDRQRLEQATAELEDILRQMPESPQARVNLATVLEKAGDLDRAEALFREALEMYPGYRLARFDLGTLLARRGDLDGAAAVYREAIERDPDSAEAHGRLGGVLERQDDLEAAAAEYRRALELDADLASFRNNLGYVLERQGKRREAAESYSRAIDSDPSYPLPYFNLADLLLEEGLVQDAATAYRAGLEQMPGNLQARYNLGLALAAAGDEPAAAAEFRRVVEGAPGHPGALSNLAWILATARDPALKDPETAVRLAQQAVELTGGEPQVLETLARTYAAAGRRREAAETAQRALEAARAAGDPELAAALEKRLEGMR